MTELNDETLKKFSELSHITSSEKEREELLKELQTMLRQADLLKEIDTTHVPPYNQVLDHIAKVGRKDEIKAILPEDRFTELT